MQEFHPKNILLTGGAGFIGSNLANYLISTYTDVIVVNLDKLNYAGSLANLQELKNNQRHHFIHDDINNGVIVASLLRQFNIDTIIHCAAETHVDRSIQAPQEFITANIVGTFTLLEAARCFWLQDQRWSHQQYRFHHISTDEVYGSLSADSPAATEASAYQPNSPYAASKASSDHLVRAYCQTYGLATTISNCSNNYGPKQHPEKMIPLIIHCCLHNQMIPVYGDGSNIRDWLYVADHCRAIDLIVRNGKIGQSYNIAANNELTNNQLVNYIVTLLDKMYAGPAAYSSLISYVADRPGHDWRYALNTTLIEQELGWQPQYSLLQGLEQTVLYELRKLNHSVA